MPISFTIKTPGAIGNMVVDFGTTVFFVGANGSGKTRLAVHIEENLGAVCHRISAHRALGLNPEVAKIGCKAALNGLKFGASKESVSIGQRASIRWGQKAATNLLNDYDFLIQALFAEQSITALQSHKNVRAGKGLPAALTKFERLVEIWDRLLPHRGLNISGDNITVFSDVNRDYPATEMSDGERAVFYLIGQVLMADENSLLIFDEPELHIHRSILAVLWDELESARPDCAMVVISHDLDFVAARKGKKYILRSYLPDVGWNIEELPEGDFFSEEICALILGSRKPILFVEGEAASTDLAVYRACYPDWTVIPRGSCKEVLHAVITMRRNAVLTRVGCAGLIDADDYSVEEEKLFRSNGVEVLPVAQIENIFLLPDVLDVIAQVEGYAEAERVAKIEKIFDDLINHASDAKNQQLTVMTYSRRRLDRALKRIDLSQADDIESLCGLYSQSLHDINIKSFYDTIMSTLQIAITARDISNLLRWYDNKGVLALAARIRGTTKDKFEQWIVRTMRSDNCPALIDVIRANLPKVSMDVAVS